MKNIMTIQGYKALISYDAETELFRGEFLDVNGGADFYAADVNSLKQEGQLSLAIFLEECEKRGIEPKKHYSGKFILRISPEAHEAAVIAAHASGLSLNQWTTKVIEQAIR